MSISAIAFLLVYFGSLGLAVLRSPMYGLYAYMLAFYGYPPGRWWGAELPDLRWSMIAAAVTLIATFRIPRNQGASPWYANRVAQMLILFSAWLLTQTLWALVPEEHSYFFSTYAKFIVLFYLLYMIVNDERGIFQFCMAHVAGCAYFGWIAFNTADGGRFEFIGGPSMDGASALAVQLSTGLIFAGILLLQTTGYVRCLVLLAIPFIANAIILTQSRGAFVGLLAGALFATYLCPKQYRKIFYGAGALGALLFVILAHDVFWTRMTTIIDAVEGEGMDSSAKSRWVLLDAQWDMFARDPVLGTGHRGTVILSPLYLDEKWLSEGGRASHNTWMSLLVEQGLVGTTFFLVLSVWAVRRLRMLKRQDTMEQSQPLGLYRAAIGGALATIFVAGQFADLLRLEVTIWCFALLVVVWNLSLQRSAAGVVSSVGDADQARGHATAVTPRV